MTVALPILSACGHETCILPTALLSTHTGGFGKPVVVHMGQALEDMWKHWKENDITFDAILVGYLGSVEAVAEVAEIAKELLASDGKLIVDPAMADHGKRYSGLSEEYAEAMMKLCLQADVMIPNITEAAMMAGIPYREEYDEAYIAELMAALGGNDVVLTGVGYMPEETGILVRSKGLTSHYTHAKVGKSYHGTGDMFAACFTGCWLQRRSMEEAVKIAGEFTRRSIEETYRNPAHWYGVKFETVLPWLTKELFG
jgi:pyridoxine kinase